MDVARDVFSARSDLPVRDFQCLLPPNGASHRSDRARLFICSIMKIQAEALSDVGRKRKGNEDNYFVNDDERLYVVADGMGGTLRGRWRRRSPSRRSTSSWR